MHFAGDLLRNSSVSIAEIADKVGYDSEAAFSRAFKRVTGKTPRQANDRTVSAI